MVAGALLTTVFGFHNVRAQTEPPAQANDRTRASVQKLGVGRDARVEVKLRDNTKLKGFISASGQDSFTVTDAKTGASQTVAFADVAQVKKQGGGLSTRSWIIIGAVSAAVVIVALTVVKPVLCDGC